jgi:hypothetical protein
MKWLSYLQIRRPALDAAMRARFAPGDRVSVRHQQPQEDGATPDYVRGKSGVIEELGEAHQPEHLTSNRGKTRPGQVYRMRFTAREVWPESPGASGDTLALQISEDQLEPQGRHF